SVRLEIVRFWMRDRMRHQKRAEICDQRPLTVRPYLDDAVRHVGHAVRATRTGKERVQRATDEGDVRHATHQTTERHTRLARREIVSDNGADARSADLRDVGRSAARVWPNRSDDLRALADRSRRATTPALRDIQIAVGSEGKAARVVETTREDGEGVRRRRVLRLLGNRAGAQAGAWHGRR